MTEEEICEYVKRENPYSNRGLGEWQLLIEIRTQQYLKFQNLILTHIGGDNTNERERLEKIVFEAWKECTKRICVAASFDFDGLFFSVEPKHWLDEYLSENK